jgi:hypothetical protein
VAEAKIQSFQLTFWGPLKFNPKDDYVVLLGFLARVSSLMAREQ